jgi:hypothetical protein
MVTVCHRIITINPLPVAVYASYKSRYTRRFHPLDLPFYYIIAIENLSNSQTIAECCSEIAPAIISIIKFSIIKKHFTIIITCLNHMVRLKSEDIIMTYVCSFCSSLFTLTAYSSHFSKLSRAKCTAGNTDEKHCGSCGTLGQYRELRDNHTRSGSKSFNILMALTAAYKT